MGYDLGVDLGTSVTRAAVSRAGADAWLGRECVPLDGVRTGLVSALYLGEDGSVLVGEQAEQRLLTEPDRVRRQLLRRLASASPVVAGGVAHRPEELAAALLGCVIQRVAEREEEPAARVAIAHPASWDEHSGKLLVQALHEVGHSDVVLVPEPAAAAAHLAARGQLEPGRTVAVFDFGAGSLDAAVVRRDGPDVFAIVGDPVAIESPCGAELEEILFTQVLTTLGDGVGPVDVDDPEVVAAMGHLLAGCVAAKESLSSATAVTVPVLLPGVHSEVRFTRPAFEAMIRPTLQPAVRALCTVTPQDADAVLLVGGCARIPLVAELLTAELQRPVTVDADAMTAVSLGAALAASRARERGEAADVVMAGPVTPWAKPPPLASRRPTRTRVLAAAAGLVGMLAIAVPVALTGGTEPGRAGAGAEFPITAPTTDSPAPTQAAPGAPVLTGPGASTPVAAHSPLSTDGTAAAAPAHPSTPALVGATAPPPGVPTTSHDIGAMPLLSSRGPWPGSTAPTRDPSPTPSPSSSPAPTPTPDPSPSSPPSSTVAAPPSPSSSSAAPQGGSDNAARPDAPGRASRDEP